MKRETKDKKIISNIIIIILIITIIISSFFVLKQNKEEKEVIRELKQTKIEKPIENNISVDEEIGILKDKYNNKDIVAILTNNDLYVPITKYKNNDYYLNHSITKERSILGNPFMDYRQNANSKQINIYGHNSPKYTPPFQLLVNYVNKSYYDKYDTITLKIDNQERKYKIFSVLIAKKDGNEEHFKYKFNNDENWLDHFNKLKKRSLYDTSVNINKEDNILILQTCIYGKYKGNLLVVVAVEIK